MGLTLKVLHEQIDQCTVCNSFVQPLRKPLPGINRGDGHDLFIVGQAPGRTEVKSRRAFSGGSGSRLDNWLVACGRPAKEPRKGVYLTSILKCPMNKPSDFTGMARRCKHFLVSQLEIIQPRILITLGKESFDFLKLEDGEYTDMIGKIYYPAHGALISHHPYTAIVHWPHPSGLNRWHNEPENSQRLRASFAAINELLEAKA